MSRLANLASASALTDSSVEPCCSAYALLVQGILDGEGGVDAERLGRDGDCVLSSALCGRKGGEDRK